MYKENEARIKAEKEREAAAAAKAKEEAARADAEAEKRKVPMTIHEAVRRRREEEMRRQQEFEHPSKIKAESISPMAPELSIEELTEALEDF